MSNKNSESQIVVSGPENSIPVTDFIGEATIGGLPIRGAVLYADTDNPVRVFVQREIVKLLTGNAKGGLQRYLSPKNLQPYLPDKFKSLDLSASTLRFKIAKTGQHAQGFIGSDLIDICRMYMSARTDGKLLPSQVHLAAQAEIIVIAFAKSGVDGFIDNISGYEKVRKDWELRRNIEKYFADEIKRYAFQFPTEFYKLIFKLNGWPYDDESIKKRPSIIGKCTNEMIYMRFPKGVFAKIQEKNPVTEKGYKKYKNYNLLTEEVGLPELQEFISNTMFLMRAAPNWKRFKNSLQRALGNPYQGDLFE